MPVVRHYDIRKDAHFVCLLYFIKQIFKVTIVRFVFKDSCSDVRSIDHVIHVISEIDTRCATHENILLRYAWWVSVSLMVVSAAMWSAGLRRTSAM